MKIARYKYDGRIIKWINVGMKLCQVRGLVAKIELMMNTEAFISLKG
ncbi:hypothetical protein M2263_001508 [Providencia alcalifaciens]|nr:hypothetical protein [Providencia alcalifaciens]